MSSPSFTRDRSWHLPKRFTVIGAMGLFAVRCGGTAPKTESPEASSARGDATGAAPIAAVASSSPAAASPPPAAPTASSALTPSSEALPPAANADTPPKSKCPAGSVFVAGGEFVTLGMKQHVSVGDLCVDATETTAAAYAQCVAAGGCSADHLDCSEQSTYGKPDRQNQPIVCVNFWQAEAYCSYQKKRLPRTEEWEWIARGGEAGRKFPWGEEVPAEQLCWSGKKAQPMSCPVASFAAGDSALGIHDLAGNVLEFTTTAQDAKSSVRIARGGSWKDGLAELVRVSRVGGFELSYRCGFLGIRCIAPSP